ncbi:Erf-like ssDNA annealing protein [Shigella phage vB_SflS-ISF001]|uniref:Putative recombination protein n=1 Tax=Shigella phage vB_SflS-ISF001 TaxID=2048005 RepID=A0A2D1GQ52_9CAUD|nr:Erf-like ssDNA annealing protein [Shigella phage vB_SflS-ISF001]ATN94095.1 putative recombination protein [Shigella phage vB_SflS-ISF001]
MQLSPETNEILPGLFNARNKFAIAKKDAKNIHLKNLYATLGAMMAGVSPALTDNDIMILQSMLDTSTETTFHLETMLIHKSGQWAKFFMMMPIAKRDPQGVGSAKTYARPYSLAAALGISQSDDDAQHAVKSVKDWKKELDACVDIESLKDVWASAYRQSDTASKSIIQDHYNALKAKFEVGKARGIRPALRGLIILDEATSAKPVQSQSITNYE